MILFSSFSFILWKWISNAFYLFPMLHTNNVSVSVSRWFIVCVSVTRKTGFSLEYQINALNKHVFNLYFASIFSFFALLLLVQQWNRYTLVILLKSKQKREKYLFAAMCAAVFLPKYGTKYSIYFFYSAWYDHVHQHTHTHRYRCILFYEYDGVEKNFV